MYSLRCLSEKGGRLNLNLRHIYTSGVRIVRCFTLPAGAKVALIDLATLPAAPFTSRGIGGVVGLNHGLSIFQVPVPDDPKFRKTVEKWDFSQASGELSVLDETGNSRLLEKIFQVANVSQGLVRH